VQNATTNIHDAVSALSLIAYFRPQPQFSTADIGFRPEYDLLVGAILWLLTCVRASMNIRSAVRLWLVGSTAFTVAVSVLALNPTRGYADQAVRAQAPSKCRAPAHHKALVHTSRLVVWEISRVEYEVATVETYYACTLPHGPKRVIAQEESELEGGSSLEGLTSAGVFVGFNERYGSKNGGDERLTVDDVLTGHKFEIVVESYATEYGGGGDRQLPELERLGEPIGKRVHTFVLNGSGDVAWLGETEHSPTKPGQFVLYLHDHHGTRKLASGPDISGLAFIGTSLTWQSAGVAQSAPA
jgi:hypothetical protein